VVEKHDRYIKGQTETEVKVRGFFRLRNINIVVYFSILLHSFNIEYNQHGGRKDNTIILTNGQLAISTTSGEAHV
jgi:hypothetical protein